MREETLTRQFANHLSEPVIPQVVLTWLHEEVAASDQTEASAREQEGRRRKAEIERLQRRLDILYEDRLEQRIKAATSDEKAAETQQALDRARQILDEIESAAVAPARRAVDLIALASRTAELFIQQPGSEQRKLVQLIPDGAVWQHGELRMFIKKPFEQIKGIEPRNQVQTRPVRPGPLVSGGEGGGFNPLRTQSCFNLQIIGCHRCQICPRHHGPLHHFHTTDCPDRKS